MRTLIRLAVVIVVAVALAVGYQQWQKRQLGVEVPSPVVDMTPTPSAPAEPSGPRYPIPLPAAAPVMQETPALSSEQPRVEATPPPEPAPLAEPLPGLNESNAVMTGVLSRLFGADVLSALFNPDELVRRFVVTVDNLPNKKLPRQQLLVKRVTGPFAVAGEGGQLMIGPDNAVRYAPYVQLAAHTDAQQLVAVYVRFYPLFQAAYAELGEPNAYFNDRLVEVIDHLLDTPTVEEPIRTRRLQSAGCCSPARCRRRCSPGDSRGVESARILSPPSPHSRLGNPF